MPQATTRVPTTPNHYPAPTRTAPPPKSPMINCRSVGEAFAFGLVRCITMQGVAHDTVMGLLAGQPEARILWRPVHDERDGDGLTTLTAVVGAHPDIVTGVGFAALVDLIQNCCRVLDVKHRQSPHLPVAVARMGIVGELYIYRPIIVKAILYLLADLIVGQWRQEGKCSLRQVKSHSNKSSFIFEPCLHP